MDIFQAKKIHMIGVKGVGMAMLAQYLAGQGVKVSGSDTAEVFMTDEPLRRSGVEIIEKFSRGNLKNDIDLIIYSTAYNQKNEELAAAMAGKIPVLSFPEAAALVFNKKFGISVIGSHGKTTITAWLGYVLDKSGKSPSVMVGANVPQFGGLALVGQSAYFIMETDEYQNKFRYFNPQAIILNNIDYDHPDFFQSKDDYQQAFVEYISRLPRRGFLIANFDDPIVRKIANVNCRARVISYALAEEADYVAYDIKEDRGRQYFKVKFDISDEEAGLGSAEDSLLGGFSISLPGRHNIANALAVIAAAVELDVPLFKIREHLEGFNGASRRLEILGSYQGAVVVDDYAHHPTEIKASLAAVKQKFPGKRIIAVFHPHTFSRTKALLNEFAQSFSQADEIIILDIYGSAREAQGGISSTDLVEKINLSGASAKYLPKLSDAEKYLRQHLGRGDVLILMGAGDLNKIGYNLVA